MISPQNSPHISTISRALEAEDLPMSPRISTISRAPEAEHALSSSNLRSRGGVFNRVQPYSQPSSRTRVFKFFFREGRRLNFCIHESGLPSGVAAPGARRGLLPARCRPSRVPRQRKG